MGFRMGICVYDKVVYPADSPEPLGNWLYSSVRAVERWINNYGQRCWLRQLTPSATREQEDQVLRVIARMDGTPFPTTARMAGRWGTVAINAPLTRPLGRCCLDDDCRCRQDPGTRSRELERELGRMGVPTLATAIIKV